MCCNQRNGLLYCRTFSLMTNKTLQVESVLWQYPAIGAGPFLPVVLPNSYATLPPCGFVSTLLNKGVIPQTLSGLVKLPYNRYSKYRWSSHRYCLVRTNFLIIDIVNIDGHPTDTVWYGPTFIIYIVNIDGHPTYTVCTDQLLYNKYRW